MIRYINSLPIEKELEERFDEFFNKSQIKCIGGYRIDEEMQTAAILTKDCLDRIREAPTADVVEVVRCKDCVYCRPYDDDKLYCHKKANIFVPIVDANDYCSYGERREECKPKK